MTTNLHRPTVLVISPAFPADVAYFTKALAEVDARILAVGDQHDLPDDISRVLSGYLHIPNLWNEDATVNQVTDWLRHHNQLDQIDRVECLWEPGVVLAAKLRARLGVPGISVDQATTFRNKEDMKKVLDAAGIRTPHHYNATTKAEVRDAAERIGFPVVVKPIDGAGSADTYTASDSAELEDALAKLGHVPEVSVEEFIEGEEYTFDTVTANHQVLFQNVTWYRPKPLVTRLNPWISQTAVCLRDLEPVSAGVNLGYRVLEALGFDTGFTHMEWFLTPSGEAVFGEIGARSPGGRLPHGMNFSADIDVFRGWAEAVCYGSFTQDTTKSYNAALIFKRASGPGTHISRIEGLEPILAEYGQYLPVIDLVGPGQPRRDWRQVVTGDGWMVARHPDLETTLRLADRLASEVRIVAG